MPAYTDQLGNVLHFQRKPQRIVSIVPSQSEFLWEIGLKDELKGITKFCVHPREMFESVERVGGTKKLDLKKIRQLRPDLIIGNKEENERSQIEALQKEFPVWMSDICTFEDAFSMMRELGTMLGRQKESDVLLNSLKESLARIRNSFAGQKIAYFIWNKPYMFAGKNTFIDHVLSYVGFENALSHKERYPELDDRTLQQLAPDYCFLSSEPFPFKEKHIKELQNILPDSKILIVDGEMFSWYGSRLLHLEKYINELRKQILSYH